MGRAPSPCNSITEKELEKKKGPWTPEEDRKLFAYIQIYGHGSWPSLPSKAGLRRCGKSCRLRWINNLKPDIKRGNFSLKEEQTIIQLHALLGNRWSAIANHLPKRTDNEIKNYWNTRIKKNLTKSGIDPTTHKPIITHGGSLLGSGQTKDASNLIGHRAQWEIARLEAEARLSTHYRRSKTLMSDKYDPNCRLQHGYPNSSARDQLVGNMPALISPRPQPQQPLCLDHVPSAWRRIMSSSQSSNNAFTVWSSLENSDFLDSTDALSCPIIDQCTRAISDNPSTAEILTNIIQNDAETLKPNDDINDLRDTIKEKLQENPIMIHNPFNCFSEEGFGTESWSDGGDGDFEILENWNTSVLMSNLADYNSPLGTPIYWEPELFQ